MSIDGGVQARCGGDLEPEGGEVGDDHVSTSGSEHHPVQGADRTCPDDDRRLPRLDGQPVGAVDHARERLGPHRLPEGHLGGDPVQGPLRGGAVAREAPIAIDTYGGPVLAVETLAGLAVAAQITSQVGGHRDAVPRRDLPGLCADLDHPADELVAQNGPRSGREAGGDRQDVQVGAAHPAALVLHDHPVGCRKGGQGTRLQFEDPFPEEHPGEHGAAHDSPPTMTRSWNRRFRLCMIISQPPG